MTKPETALLDPEEVEAIFLTVTTKVQELLVGEHRSIFTGTSGVEFASVREKQPDDPMRKVDWARSTLTGFNPLIIREVVEERSVEVVIVSDASLSTRFGVGGITIAHGIAKTIATVGFSAAVIQDPVAQLVFSESKFGFEPFRMGKNHILHLLELYRDPDHPVNDFEAGELAGIVTGELRRKSLVIFISDFLSPNAEDMCRGLVDISSPNDVAVLMVDSSFAFDLPKVSSSWVGCYDAVRRRHAILSARELRQLKSKVIAYQEETASAIKKSGLEVLRVDPLSEMFYDDMLNFFLNRELSKA